MASINANSKPNKPGVASQRFLNIQEIRDDVVIMKDGTLRAILLVSSLNFALKSIDEQEAIIQAYMAFLNSLEFPIQIVVQSRQMNIDGYLESIHQYEKQTTNELLKTQIADYRNFIQELIEIGQIMQKRFYVVIPYDPMQEKKKKHFFTRLQEAFSPSVGIKLKEKQFQDRREAIIRRIPIIQSQLNSMGLESVLLNTQSLIELFYLTYNPDLFQTEKLSDISQIQHEES
ncbi:hypothetical protein CO172_02055 [Candidatus Uhrbacteria bacterium CG_4_9_14_3_um_filter_36_7]|uniref:TraC-like domain-containing protein n=1 Tax=Candidatus Uhrbacteria bacterium CG_4_9_14_3_um_filter_36_7 TaxID=1975033 RepID=A0A2M7XHG8_9BACT|nr:MAG: hypothetical protein CO172_02055 [Candidatus Uhrbacteria bacterium CG_4_9_14_3_um_filter_36_7]